MRVRMVAGMLLLGVADLVENAAFHVLPLPGRTPVPTDVDEDGWARDGDGTRRPPTIDEFYAKDTRWPSE